MRLPVDTSAIAFLCALEPQPLLDFQSKQPRADENGEPLYVRAPRPTPGPRG